MKYAITILFFSVLMIGCNRTLIPSPTVTMDSTSITKDSVVLKDTTISFEGHEVTLQVNADSLLSILKEIDGMPRIDSAEITKLFVIDSGTNGNVHGSIYFNDGMLYFDCKADSLQSVIVQLRSQYLELYLQKNKTTTVTVPGPTVTVTKLPTWFWYVLAFVISYFGLKVLAIFYTPSSGILQMILNLFK